MWLDEPGSPVWAPASNPPTSHHSLSEGAYLDDAVYFTAAAMPVGLFSSLASFAGVVFEAMVQHMLTLNLKRGKTEAVVLLRGPGSRATTDKIFRDGKSPVLHLARTLLPLHRRHLQTHGPHLKP